MRSASEKMNNERHWVANLRPIANRPGRVTTLGQAGCHVIFRPCRAWRKGSGTGRMRENKNRSSVPRLKLVLPFLYRGFHRRNDLTR